VLNGLLERLDWESAIKVPLGIVPAGMFVISIRKRIYIKCAAFVLQTIFVLLLSALNGQL
jgi:hypothetical protein